jgi:SWI/SNF related-matrix-associated actin-dependent regulator of chromatin subfamily C
MEEKRSEAGTAPAVGAESPASEPSSSRRRSGAQKRKASNFGASNFSSALSKRITREKALLSHPPIHNGPLTRARQGPNNLAASALAPQGGAAAPAKKPNEQAMAAAAAEELSKKSELVALEAAMEAELEAVRSRGANAHVVPSHCGEFWCLKP